ncbi:hypothetical protein GCM10014715_14670 [Streptomyces spiralis]|uniref:Uncharacterized protein n=1 Tax=Streptomyces spiralis TaxID=66376 RepID=A0A918ZQ29_9ACTN|nr:hypothetical protein [Streptomyces spiralis]GHE62157.1 hypothetical protein GCM10014715_14670 [Streptomyces spiralis]
MSPRDEFQVLLRRIGRWWAVDIPTLDLHTQCRTLEGAEDLARGMVAEAVGVPAEVIVLKMVVPELAPVLGPVAEARQRRAAAVAAEDEAIAAAVHKLVDKLHVSQGDAARLLGMPTSEVAHFTPERGSAATGPGQGARPRTSGPAPSPPRPAVAVPASGSRPGLPRRQRQASSSARPAWATSDDGTPGRD